MPPLSDAVAAWLPGDAASASSTRSPSGDVIDAARVAGARRGEDGTRHAGGEEQLGGGGRGDGARRRVRAAPEAERAGVEGRARAEAGVLGDAEVDEDRGLVEGDGHLVRARRAAATFAA